ncbi:hypothetical protein OPV22_001360 [Ensete ventricosum]|uniref:Secreted protein n=1 Tax=Ensete ventricosum TaxID=4639 RepID=A0AAV8RS53_ENSVE|nr:hypothetical protein OPV22_001360 [Ensete ventricosum]
MQIAALLFVRGGGSGGPCRRHRRQRLRIPRQGDRQKGHPRRRSHGRQAPTRPTRKVLECLTKFQKSCRRVGGCPVLKVY